MQLKNLECQLAMAQLKRYTAGAKLSDEALEALEAHLVECLDCQRSVQSLNHVPNPDAPAQAVVQSRENEMNSPTPATKKLGKFGLNLNANQKTLIYSVVLAGVLLLMSTLANNPTKLFGERVLTNSPGSSAKTPAQNPTPAAKPTPKPVVASAVAEQKPIEDSKPVSEPAATPKPKTRVIRQQPISRPVRRATVARKSPAKAQTKPAAKPQPKQAVPGGITVYDENGNRL